MFTYIRTLTIAMLWTTLCKWWHIRGVWIEDVLFVQSWAGCSRSLKTHLRLSPTHVPSSSELCRLMPPLQLLCSWSKRRQTGAISIHWPPPHPALINSTPTPYFLCKGKTPSPLLKMLNWPNPLLLGLPYLLLLFLCHHIFQSVSKACTSFWNKSATSAWHQKSNKVF